MNVAYIITSRRHVAEYEVGFLSCLHFAKRNSLYSEVILKPKQVIFWVISDQILKQLCSSESTV